MRVRVTVDAQPMLEASRGALRVFVLSELHRVLHGYDAWIDEIDAAFARRGRDDEVLWDARFAVTLWDGTRFEVQASARRPHVAADEAVHGVWRAMRRAVRGDVAHGPQHALTGT